ncbi:glycine cleavage system protein H, partial [Acinetobacter baumannii]
KAASDIYAPVAGEVVAINDAVKDAPESVNANAVDAWLFKIKPANGDDVNGLMTADAYKASVGA